MTVRFTKSIGMLLLGIWLILFALAGYVPLFASLGILLNFLAIAAGGFYPHRALAPRPAGTTRGATRSRTTGVLRP